MSPNHRPSGRGAPQVLAHPAVSRRARRRRSSTPTTTSSWKPCSSSTSRLSTRANPRSTRSRAPMSRACGLVQCAGHGSLAAALRRRRRTRLRPRRRRPRRLNGSGADIPFIADEDVAKCTNCKTCYQELQRAVREDHGSSSTARRRKSATSSRARLRTREGHAGSEGQASPASPPTAMRRSSMSTDRIRRRDELDRYRAGDARALEATQNEIEKLEHTRGRSSVFQKQLELLRKRLLGDPQSLRRCSSTTACRPSSGSSSRTKLGAGFTKTLWNLLPARRRHEHDPAALHLGRAAQVQAQVHQARSTSICPTAIRCSRACRRAGRRRTASRPTSARRRSGRTTSSS